MSARDSRADADVDAASAAAETKRLQGQPAGSAYGAVAPVEKKRTWLWYEFGDPFWLFVEAMSVVGEHFMSMLLIIYQCIMGRRFTINCDVQFTSALGAASCEYAQAYLRLFPLLAIVIALMLAGRMMLHRRVYYEFLRHKALVDFENLDFWRDPLVYWLCWDFVHVLFHMCMVVALSSQNFLDQNSMSLEGMLKTIDVTKANSPGALLRDFVLYYVSPTAVFFMFFWGAYDSEAMLLPLNKYVEEDPEAASAALMETVIVPEAIAASVVRSGLHGAATETVTSTQAYMEVVNRVQFVREDAALLSTIQSAAVQAQEEAVKKDLRRSRAFRMSVLKRRSQRWVKEKMTPVLQATLWPADLLLHPNVNDEAAGSFRKMWNVFTVISLLLMAGVLSVFVWYSVTSCVAISKGRVSVGASVTVEIGHCLVTLWMAKHLLATLLVPWRTPKVPASNLPIDPDMLQQWSAKQHAEEAKTN